MEKQIAIYVRVSTRQQDTRSQLPDLKRWIGAYADGKPVVWYREQASGKSMDRPGWRKLEAAIHAGKVSKIVVWRLVRLGRTARGLTLCLTTCARGRSDSSRSKIASIW